MTAIKNGEQFDTESGLPASELRKKTEGTWFEHAVKFAEVKWKGSSAKSRAARADALATITPALVTDHRGAPDRRVLRRALSCWAFNFSEHQPEQPEEIREALAWLERKSVQIGQLEDPDTIRRALDALSQLPNGVRDGGSGRAASFRGSVRFDHVMPRVASGRVGFWAHDHLCRPPVRGEDKSVGERPGPRALMGVKPQECAN
nr:hypothetical protein KitaXyl93_22900 [Kitasatospora sp. Xyl93]